MKYLHCDLHQDVFVENESIKEWMADSLSVDEMQEKVICEGYQPPFIVE